MALCKRDPWTSEPSACGVEVPGLRCSGPPGVGQAYTVNDANHSPLIGCISKNKLVQRVQHVNDLLTYTAVNLFVLFSRYCAIHSDKFMLNDRSAFQIESRYS